ncbi:MAG: hypothetical protein HZC42_14085 [Candidatus Eisenbacteria bacterium]|nr:hypothetical protein [Candidatus Eisenbacteria bacterium]
MRRPALLPLLALVLAAAAHAGLPASRARVLLTVADSPAALRAGLLAIADSIEAADRYGAGEAHYFAGLSYDRAALPESALACYRRAVMLRGGNEELFALSDLLLRRRDAGDVAEALRWLEPALAGSPDGDAAARAALQGRVAWAQFLADRPDSAAALFEPLEPRLALRSEWRYRLARVAMARGDYRRVVDMLIPNAVLSRTSDLEVLDLLERASDKLGMLRRVKDEVRRAIEVRDRVERAHAAALGGQRVRFSASDGFPLGGLAVPAAGTRRHRAAVIVVAAGDTLLAYDSLVVALRAHGVSVMLLDPRGSGWSVAPACPMPEAWVGRQQATHARVALDVRDALRALARVTPVDTGAYLAAGAGSSASIAVEAATVDRRIRALLLVSPTPAPVDRGTTCSRLARLQLPAFFQIAPEDYTVTWEITDALYQAGNRAASRVADSASPGHGAAQFAADPALARRFTAWLDGVLPARVAPRATPRARRRPG